MNGNGSLKWAKDGNNLSYQSKLSLKTCSDHAFLIKGGDRVINLLGQSIETNVFLTLRTLTYVNKPKSPGGGGAF